MDFNDLKGMLGEVKTRMDSNIDRVRKDMAKRLLAGGPVVVPGGVAVPAGWPAARIAEFLDDAESRGPCDTWIVKPAFESKDDYEAIYLLARKLGFADLMFKNILVERNRPSPEDILREINCSGLPPSSCERPYATMTLSRGSAAMNS